MARVFAGVAVGSTLGCATPPAPPPPRLVRLRLAVGEVVLSLERREAESTLAWLEPALRGAADDNLAFGLRLAEPITLAVHPTIAGFVEATGRTQPWLRAWAGWARVDVLGLRFWEDPSPLAQRERLAHELAHCTMFHALGSYPRAVRAAVPWWFLEGAASVIARQGTRRMPLPEVLEQAQGRSPLERPAPGRDHALTYGAAHHAMALLMARHGRGAVARVLREARHHDVSVASALQRSEGETAASLWRGLLAQRAGT